MRPLWVFSPSAPKFTSEEVSRALCILVVGKNSSSAGSKLVLQEKEKVKWRDRVPPLPAFRRRIKDVNGQARN
jgi:hypothetical protein